MGDRQGHIRKAQHNESFVRKQILQLRGCNDWKVTAIFYAAVHYIDAGLARMNIHPIRHEGKEGRNTYASVHFRKIASKYQTLYNRSRYARYTPDSENNIQQSDVEPLLGYLQHFQNL